MTEQCAVKLERLREMLRETGGCAIAYSGGVDSSVLVAAGHEVLGDRCLAVTAMSSTYSRREGEQAVAWLEARGIPHEVIVSEELDIPEFSDNPPDRCYFCKHELFTKVREQAEAHGIGYVADGTNADDLLDHRPGLRAAEELGVLSPLREAGLTKEEIRAIARETYELPMADKPAMACMASRFPYGSTITRDKLAQVEAIEAFLADHGFEVYRARHHGEVLRLELDDIGLRTLLSPALHEPFIAFAKAQGFTYVTADLEGYRTGSMNEALTGRAAAERSSTSPEPVM
jgi:uncharacterized protein